MMKTEPHALLRKFGVQDALFHEEMVRDELKRIQLTSKEWFAVIDALSGVFASPEGLASVTEDILAQVDILKKWSVNKEGLSAKFYGMSVAQKLALLEVRGRFNLAVEKFKVDREEALELALASLSDCGQMATIHSA